MRDPDIVAKQSQLVLCIYPGHLWRIFLFCLQKRIYLNPVYLVFLPQLIKLKCQMGIAQSKKHLKKGLTKK